MKHTVVISSAFTSATTVDEPFDIEAGRHKKECLDIYFCKENLKYGTRQKRPNL